MKQGARQVKYSHRPALLSFLFLSFIFAGITGFKYNPYGCRDAGPSRASTGRVARVIDGDTIILRDGRKIRYLNIDCPERGEPFFDRALRHNRRLVDGRDVGLTFCPEKERDRYGRWLAHVRCGDLHAGRALLREGLAFLLLITRCDPAEEEAMVIAFQSARAEGRGIWGQEGLFRVSPEEASGAIGRHAIIEGRVTGSFSSGRLIFFNIGPRTDRNLRLVVMSPYFSAFRERGVTIPDTYEEKSVKAWGKLIDYKGRPEIFLYSPDQIDMAGPANPADLR
jgi:micrococcal nuclease